MGDRQKIEMTSVTQSKSENVRKSREKFERTLEELRSRATVSGIVDETVGKFLEQKPRNDALVSAAAVAGVAWLINAFPKSINPFTYSAIKTSTSKKEKINHENLNRINRQREVKGGNGRKIRSPQGEVEDQV